MKSLLLVGLLAIVVIVSGCTQSGQVISDNTQEKTEVNSNDDECIEKWECADWNICHFSENENIQTRICTDNNNCNTEKNRPIELQNCVRTFSVGEILNNGYIEFTVHSARKASVISSNTPKDGFVYLIVDVSLKNLNISEGQPFDSDYLEIEYAATYTYKNSWDSSDLIDYFTPTTVDLGKTRRGEIAFEVPIKTENMILILKEDARGQGIAYIDLGDIENPSTAEAQITMKDVSYTWYDYSNKGTIRSVNFLVENTGDVIIKPKYVVEVTNYYTNRLFDMKEKTSSRLLPGETDEVSTWLSTDVDSKTKYRVQVSLYDINSGELIDINAAYADMKNDS